MEDSNLLDPYNTLLSLFFCGIMALVGLSQFNHIFNVNNCILFLILCSTDSVAVSECYQLLTAPLDANQPASTLLISDINVSVYCGNLYDYLGLKNVDYDTLNDYLMIVSWLFLNNVTRIHSWLDIF